MYAENFGRVQATSETDAAVMGEELTARLAGISGLAGT